jgi:hypothetical protein
MPQDRLTGAAANDWGRDTAKKVAAALGASPIRKGTNECLMNGERIGIKCAAVKTDSVGVTYKMLPHLDRIIGAFQLDDGSFELLSLTPSQFESSTTPTRSRGAAAGKVGIVKRVIFHSEGRLVGRIHP